MPSAKTQPARGMRDFLPEDVRKREYVIGVIKDVYERYGFEPLETPAAENIETLMGKYGEEGNQLIFKILKRGVHESTGEADLALRYDLTVPLARVVAELVADPAHRRRFERLETIALEDLLDDADNVFAAPHVGRQKIAHAPRGLCV